MNDIKQHERENTVKQGRNKADETAQIRMKSSCPKQQIYNA